MEELQGESAGGRKAQGAYENLEENEKRYASGKNCYLGCYSIIPLELQGQILPC